MTNFYNWGIASQIGPEDIAVLKDLNFEFQLGAIEKLTQLHLKYRLELDEEIKRRELVARKCEGPNNYDEVEWHIEALYESTYVEGALCMSFVGMALPLIETIFSRFFMHLGENWKDDMDLSCPRCQKLRKKDFWDCRKFVNSELKILGDIREGILQLCVYTGFSNYLAPEFSKILTLFFKFRNNLFHNGTEWPLNRRKEFQNLLNDLEFNHLFLILTSGDEPWMFTMTDECIEYCEKLIRETYYAMNRYCLNNQLL